MQNRSFYNEILTEHNIRPEFKHDLENPDIVIKGSENGYNFRFESSSFDIRAGRGVRFFALRV